MKNVFRPLVAYFTIGQRSSGDGGRGAETDQKQKKKKKIILSCLSERKKKKDDAVFVMVRAL